MHVIICFHSKRTEHPIDKQAFFLENRDDQTMKIKEAGGITMKHVLINDSIVPEAEAHVSYIDRGYHFGDGIYEVIRIYQGSFFALDPHINRLFDSAKKIDIALPISKQELMDRLDLLKEKEIVTNGSIYVQITRGAAERNHLYSREEQPILFGFALPDKSNEANETNGIAAYVTEDIRWLRCDIKSINLLGNVMAKRKASDHDCGEAVLYRENAVTEGSSSNLFLVNNQTLYTHPANNLILNGITRQEIIAVAAELGIDIVEEPFPKEVLAHADEAFVTSTSIEITPIHTFKGDVEATLTVGPITKKLQQALKERIKTKTSASV